MARVRGPKYLTCFYCGKRTKTKYDGFTRQFLCLSCDATNYLDEDGEITDPPVATEREAPARQYAVQRASSPPTSQPQDDIFCSTCLKNQRLFTASLAQYLPDDPSHPDYSELERNYYRFRKSLEERYSQVCAECAERVEGKIRQAGYTAKTDHLRRMMERSRGRRSEPAKTTVVDWANTFGRGLWWGGLLMQMLWHLRASCILLKYSNEGMYDPDDKSWTTLLTWGVAWLVAFLPPPETLISGAITAGILSVWWNPRFVQVTRGFTRHLLGFTQWYSFQGLVIFFRFLFRRVLELEGGKGRSRNAQLSAHFVMALLMNIIYSLAQKSIKVDTTPLFGTHSAPVSPKPKKLEKRKQEDSKTLSEILNEALDSPTASTSATPRQTPLDRSYVTSLPPPYPPNNPINTQNSPQQLRIDTLGISPSPQRTQQVQYSEEMDWSPTQEQSQHRAFANPSPSNAKRAFGEAPTQPESSPFWYKVPAAPTNPAHRMRNPQLPVLRSKPVEKENVFFTSKMQSQKQEKAEEESVVTFSQPKFFAPQRENDEANSLADMLGSSFSLSQEQDGQPRRPIKPAAKWVKAPRPVHDINLRSPRAVEAMILAILLAFWVLTVSLPIPFGRELQLAILSAAGTIALRVTGDTDRDMKEVQVPSTATYVGSVLSVLELSTICWLGWEVWKGEIETGRYGFGVLTAMLGHQVWNTVM